MNVFNSVQMLLIGMTNAQTATILVLSIVLGIMVAVDFILLVLFSRERHRRHERAKDSLSRQIAMHATIHEQDTINLRKQLQELSMSAAAAERAAEARLEGGDGSGNLALESGKGSGDEEIEEKIRSGKVLVLDEDDEDSTLSYKKSFEARLIQSSDATKEWYTDIKNELLSYKKVNDSTSWKWEAFRYKRKTLVKMVFRGKTLCLYFALDPKKYAESKIAVEDVSEVNSMSDTPAMLRLKSDRKLKHAIQLVHDLMAETGVEKTEREAEDFYQARMGTVSLIKQGLIKRVVRPAKPTGKKFGKQPAKADEPASDTEAAATAPETAEPENN